MTWNIIFKLLKTLFTQLLGIIFISAGIKKDWLVKMTAYILFLQVIASISYWHQH